MTSKINFFVATQINDAELVNRGEGGGGVIMQRQQREKKLILKVCCRFRFSVRLLQCGAFLRYWLLEQVEIECNYKKIIDILITAICISPLHFKAVIKVWWLIWDSSSTKNVKNSENIFIPQHKCTDNNNVTSFCVSKFLSRVRYFGDGGQRTFLNKDESSLYWTSVSLMMKVCVCSSPCFLIHFLFGSVLALSFDSL